MTDRSSSSARVPPIVIIGIALAIIAGLGLVGFGLFGSRGSAAGVTPTLPAARTPLIIPTTTPVPPTPSPTPTTPPPTDEPEPEEPTPTETSPAPTPDSRPTTQPPTNTPAPPPTPASNLSPTFSVTNTAVNAGDRVEFNFSLTNPDSSESMQLGFVGITVMRDGAAVDWHQSWVGWVLEPGKTDTWTDGLHIGEAGTYSLWLSVCSETVENCQANLGWENVAGPVTVEVH